MMKPFLLICFLALGIEQGESLTFSGNQVEVKTDSGKAYNLKLTPAEASVLDPNIQIITIDKDVESGHLLVDSWMPSKEELKAAEDVYIDKESLATVRLQSENGELVMNGIVDGMKLETRDGTTRLRNAPPANRSDYIDMGRTITPGKMSKNWNNPTVVELLLVCDKEFGDIFQQNRQRILEYLTVYFWDMNLRYLTMPSTAISFKITGVVIINSFSGQPFIEEARASDGRAEFGRILHRFASWVYGQMNSVPKFDMAALITNTRLEWGGGLAYVRAACWVNHGDKMFLGTTVFNDDGAWGSATVGAHEIGHVLGAPHDDDGNYPGGCSDRGYIMSGATDELRFFFSTCSDRTIGDFVRSNEGSCLRRQDENNSPAISPAYNTPLAPSMTEQCQRRLNDQKAYVWPEDDEGNCKVMKCWIQQSDGGWLIWSLQPVDNTPCAIGRCFRGRCRRIGNLLVNVGSGSCVRSSNRFKSLIWAEMVACPNPSVGGTPLDRFAVEEHDGKFFSTPYQSPDGKENGDACLYTGYQEGDPLWYDKCDFNNGWQSWDTVSTGSNGEFLLRHRPTQRCAKQEGTAIKFYQSCNRNDAAFRWKLV